MMQHVPNRRGVAIIMAIVLMGLIATTLMVLARYIVSDARQVSVDRGDAQLRELLTAGAATAMSQSTHAPLAQMNVPIPKNLSGDPARLSLEPHAVANGVTIIVRANIGDSSREETLHLVADGPRWKLVSID